jgi:hypothetical protein
VARAAYGENYIALPMSHEIALPDADRRTGRATYAWRTRVEHPQWRVWRATSATLDADVATFYGGEFADALGRPPSSAYIADGSAVTVRRGMPLG